MIDFGGSVGEPIEEGEQAGEASVMDVTSRL